MSSLIHSPKSGSTTAAKLKGFGHALNKSLGIAKRWTLEKVGAKEQSQEPAEVTALIAAFQQDKADLEELRSKVAHLVTTEKTLLDADLAFAQSLDDMHIPTLPAADADPPASSTTTASADPSSTSSPPSSVPPFTPQTFASYQSSLHATHSAYLTSLSSALLEPIDQLLDNDVSILSTISRQLPLLRLDHGAKADALAAIERREDKRGLEDAQREERESREVWEAQMEVVDKLAREVATKKADVLRAVADAYHATSRQWYDAMAAVTADAVATHSAAGVQGAKQEMTVGESMEAAAETAGHKLGEVGAALMDTTGVVDHAK